MCLYMCAFIHTALTGPMDHACLRELILPLLYIQFKYPVAIYLGLKHYQKASCNVIVALEVVELCNE